MYLKWLIDWRTASSNSIGPGMSRAGWSGWFDIFFVVVLSLLVCCCAERSAEKGVLSGGSGCPGRCLEINESLEVGDASVRGSKWSRFRRRAASVTLYETLSLKGLREPLDEDIGCIEENDL